jgi:hypothetical protein
MQYLNDNEQTENAADILKKCFGDKKAEMNIKAA